MCEATGTAVDAHELTVGGVFMKASPSWTFHDLNGMILGRPDSRVGNLQITLAYRSTLGPGAGHAECRQVLAKFVSAEGPDTLADVVAEGSGDTLFGGGSVTDDRTWKRAWFRLTDTGLVLALYQCHRDRLPEAGVELTECEAIARSLTAVG